MTGPSKQELLAEIARSREAIARDFRGAGREVNPTVQFTRAVSRKPWVWTFAALAFGWALAGPKTRTRTRVVVQKSSGKGGEKSKAAKRPHGAFGMLLGIIRALSPIVKPAVTAYAAKRMAEMAQKLG